MPVVFLAQTPQNTGLGLKVKPQANSLGSVDSGLYPERGASAEAQREGRSLSWPQPHKEKPIAPS